MKPGSSEPPTMRAVIPVTLAGMRSDQALAWVFPEYSRTTLKSWILAGRVQVDGRCVEPRHVVSGGEAVELAPPPPSATLSIIGREHPEAIPIEVIHEDPEILVVNKPAGLVVHPGAGNREGTMLNALLLPRPRPRRTAAGRDRPPAGQGHLRLAGHRPQPAGPSKPGRPDQGPPDHPRVPGDRERCHGRGWFGRGGYRAASGAPNYGWQSWNGAASRP